MTAFTGMDAARALVNFAITHGSQLPEHQRLYLSQVLAGPDLLRKVIVGMETLYASRGHASFPAEGLELMLGLAQFVQAHNFYGLGGFDGRAVQVAAVAQRALSGGPRVAELDPEHSADYAAAEPVTEEPEQLDDDEDDTAGV